MERYQEIMVALSESVIKNCLKCPLAEKSWWRHIRLAIKPRYIGNHASQMKMYYETLSGSHGRSFRIRYKKSPAVPPTEEITMTSYPACNETSLSRKPCIPDKKVHMEHYEEVMVALSQSVIKNLLKHPLAEKSRWRHIRLAITPRISETMHRR